MPDKTENRALPGLKEDQLSRIGPCIVCGKHLLQPLVPPMFFSVPSSRRSGTSPPCSAGSAWPWHSVGHGGLTRIIGPDADLAKIINTPRRVASHLDCAGKVDHLLQLLANRKTRIAGKTCLPL